MPSKPSIFLALSTYTNISNVLRGKIPKELTSKYTVVVLTPFIDTTVAKRDGYYQDENIFYIKTQLAHRGLWDVMNKYFRTACVRGYDNLLMTQEWYYRPTLPRRVKLAIALGRIFPKNFPTPHTFTAIENIIARPTEQFQNLIAQYNPKIMITGTPGYLYASFDAEMIAFAKNTNLPTIAIDLSFDNPYSQAKYVRKTDYVTAWSDRMRTELHRLHGYPDENILAVGSLKFDHYFQDISENHMKSRAQFIKDKGLNPDKKLLVYATPTPGTYPPRQKFIQMLINAKRAGYLSGDPNILVRLHPLDQWEVYQDFIGIPEIHIEKAGTERIDDKKIKGASVEMTEPDLLNLTETLYYADALIEYASTLIVEACIFNTPTVSIGFPPEQKPLCDAEVTRDFVKSSGEIISLSFKELCQTVNHFLTTPQTNTDIANDKATVNEFVQFIDGKAWKRTCDYIDSIVKDRSRTSTLQK